MRWVQVMGLMVGLPTLNHRMTILFRPLASIGGSCLRLSPHQTLPLRLDPRHLPQQNGLVRQADER